MPPLKSQAWLQGIDERLASQLRFLISVDRLKTVIRGNRIADASRRENTAEHSWHLALFAVVLSEWAVGEVAIDRVVRMLILHDLVEVECGDIPLFDAVGALDQEARERKAADLVYGLLPPDQGRALRAIWEEFEAAETCDARFAKALDRLQPILLNHVVGGGTWTDFAVDDTDDPAPAAWQGRPLVDVCVDVGSVRLVDMVVALLSWEPCSGAPGEEGKSMTPVEQPTTFELVIKSSRARRPSA